MMSNRKLSSKEHLNRFAFRLSLEFLKDLYKLSAICLIIAKFSALLSFLIRHRSSLKSKSRHQPSISQCCLTAFENVSISVVDDIKYLSSLLYIPLTICLLLTIPIAFKLAHSFLFSIHSISVVKKYSLLSILP